jgi:hypothetical protein
MLFVSGGANSQRWHFGEHRGRRHHRGGRRMTTPSICRYINTRCGVRR